MNSDLIARLRAAQAGTYGGYAHDLCGTAADAIERLTREANEWRCADRDKAATIAALEIARGEAEAERDRLAEKCRLLDHAIEEQNAGIDRLRALLARCVPAVEAALAHAEEQFEATDETHWYEAVKDAKALSADIEAALAEGGQP